MNALCAVFTVFGTASALSVDDGTEVKSIAAYFSADLIGSCGQFFQRGICQQKRFFAVCLSAFQYLFFQFIYNIHRNLLTWYATAPPRRSVMRRLYPGSTCLQSPVSDVLQVLRPGNTDRYRLVPPAENSRVTEATGRWERRSRNC